MRILLVCTGNTCRTPMAETQLRSLLAERGLADVEVTSAGTGAWDGAPASEGAYLVGLEHGHDLSGHRARLLTGEHAGQADLILTMSRSHRQRVLAVVVVLAGRRQRAKPLQVGDDGGVDSVLLQELPVAGYVARDLAKQLEQVRFSTVRRIGERRTGRWREEGMQRLQGARGL